MSTMTNKKKIAADVRSALSGQSPLSIDLCVEVLADYEDELSSNNYSVQRLIDPPEVTNVAPVDCVRVVAEVVVGQLPQGLNFVENHRQALKVGVEGGGQGCHVRLRVD